MTRAIYGMGAGPIEVKSSLIYKRAQLVILEAPQINSSPRSCPSADPNMLIGPITWICRIPDSLTAASRPPVVP